ncbi:RNA polymerase factor sigma-54 [Mesorhizobium sp. YR577]|uniref:RNA polymerase factor sigma-54 n=1 Tax=Mesorhizobium sp. YR577 TaxID=1884373 RepID=UPI0008E077A4|nr:RNA polymerase factor sigma-54 [Mesorhizobium sp. YR577]SFU13526.1 RNA polymerase, sigma 54 subunit, RpoN/SigL [Mesorhizobium sp. YR577]
MALAAKLQLRQSQSLVMTPQLMQSIKLLQMTHIELDHFVDEEIERNPLLDRVEPRDDAAGDRLEKNDSAGEEWAEADTAWSAEAMSEKLDTSLENVFPDDPGVSDRVGPDLAAQWKSASGSSGSLGASEGFDMEDMAAAALTLRDHVGEQISFAFVNPADRLIAYDLTDALDEIGYMRGDVEEIEERLGVGEADVLEVLRKCQAFEPAGIFARDLAECLALQLARRDRLDPAMKALVNNLDLLARRDFQTLKKLCAVDEEDLLDMLAEIRRLDPRPGAAFSGGNTDTIVPDVEVRAASDGSWTVELNPETLPRVLVDQIYFTQVSTLTKNQAEKDFLTECLQNANWLTRSLDQRAKTILKVASEIVRQQDAFLVHGVRQLRPLNLRTVADAIGMHESTVSRVTANKYMLTPRGVFELRYFFTAAIASAGGGDAHSSEAVRDRIKQLIDEEASAEVLSDDAIVDILQRDGVDIARRTVAKYREGMNIPSSVQRRREKRAMASAGR